MNLRKSIRNLSDQEVKELRNAYARMMRIKDNRGFNHIAGFHGVPGWYCWHHQRNTHLVLRARLFLPWHRAYIYRFEQAVQDQVGGVTVPWWDWSSDASRSEGIPRSFSDNTVGGRHSNPLYKSHIYVPSANPPLNRETFRSPGSPSDLPSSGEVNNLFDLTEFGDFNDELENIHDRIHVWTGGSMQEVATAAFDPIFYSHHCMIDRIWWLWQLRNGNSGMPPNMLDLVLEPFNLTVKDVLNIYHLGYDYAGTQVSSSEGG
jgi:tyrosinase